MSFFPCLLQAQYNAPLSDLGQEGLPPYRVRVACQQLSTANLTGTNLLRSMTRALNVFTANTSYTGGCLDLAETPPEPEPEPPGNHTPSASGNYGVSQAAPEAAPQHESAQQEKAAPAPQAAPELSADDIFGFQVGCAYAHARAHTQCL